MLAANLRKERIKDLALSSGELIESIPQALWITDTKGRVNFFNRYWYDYTGLPYPDRGEGWGLALHPKDVDRAAHEWFEASRKGCAYDIEYRLRRRDGVYRWHSARISPQKDDLGRISKWLGSSIEIHDKKESDLQRQKAVAALYENNRRQIDFVANVSHELRTPVAAIKGFSETLRRGGIDDQRNRLKFIRVIESHADRLSWLIEDLMTLSRLQTGEKLSLKGIDLRSFISEYIDSIRSVAMGYGVSIKSTVPSGMRAMADSQYLTQVIENLIGNALKYNRPQGTVIISAKEERGMVRLTVRDTGIGIAKEHLSLIFDRFFRVDRASTGHSGLGLHIVESIIKAHGGRAWAESRLGRGSAFHVTLPAQSKADL